MASKLKVYHAEIGGLHDWIVAAHSQKEAAAIWGVDTAVFARGKGGPTTRPDAVKAAMKAPGTALRRLKTSKGGYQPINKKGDLEGWALAAKAAGIDPARPPKRPAPAKTAKRPVPSAAKPTKPAKVIRPPKPPSRAVLTKAERKFAAFERTADRQRDTLRAERERLDDKAIKLDTRLTAERARLTEALHAARKAYDEARR